jgi:hypothetical protein
VTQTVKIATTLALTSSKNPSHRNNMVVFTAAVAPSSVARAVRWRHAAGNREPERRQRVAIDERAESRHPHDPGRLWRDATHGGSSATLSQVVQH